VRVRGRPGAGAARVSPDTPQGDGSISGAGLAAESRAANRPAKQCPVPAQDAGVEHASKGRRGALGQRIDRPARAIPPLDDRFGYAGLVVARSARPRRTWSRDAHARRRPARLSGRVHRQPCAGHPRRSVSSGQSLQFSGRSVVGCGRCAFAKHVRAGGGRRCRSACCGRCGSRSSSARFVQRVSVPAFDQ